MINLDIAASLQVSCCIITPREDAALRYASTFHWKDIKLCMGIKFYTEHLLMSKTNFSLGFLALLKYSFLEEKFNSREMAQRPIVTWTPKRIGRLNLYLIETAETMQETRKDVQRYSSCRKCMGGLLGHFEMAPQFLCRLNADSFIKLNWVNVFSENATKEEAERLKKPI